jgi:hypothetical protein
MSRMTPEQRERLNAAPRFRILDTGTGETVLTCFDREALDVIARRTMDPNLIGPRLVDAVGPLIVERI